MLLLHCNVVVVGLICIKCSILYVTMCHGMNEWTIQFAISMVLVLASALYYMDSTSFRVCASDSCD